MRVRDEPGIFKDFQSPIDRRQVHALEGLVDLRQNLLGGGVVQPLDRLDDELSLRSDADVVLAKLLSPVHLRQPFKTGIVRRMCWSGTSPQCAQVLCRPIA